MDNRRALTVIAGIVLAIGLLMLVVPTSVSGDVDCGNVIAPDTSAASAAELHDSILDVYGGGDGSDDGGYRERCEDRISTQRLIAFPITGIGALTLLFLMLTRPEPVRTEVTEDERSAS